MNYHNFRISSFLYKFFESFIVVLLLILLMILFLILSANNIKDQYNLMLMISLLFIILSSLFILIKAFLQYVSMGFLIDNNSIRFKQGFFVKHETTIPFNKITNATLSQNILQQLFGVGNLHIDQEDSNYIIIDIDNKNAQVITTTVASKSPVQVWSGK